MTTRPSSAGETTQFQTQWWLERNGFPLPSVSRCRLARRRGQRLEARYRGRRPPDQLCRHHCGVAAKAVLLLRRTIQRYAIKHWRAASRSSTRSPPRSTRSRQFEEAKRSSLGPSLPPCGLVQAVKARGRASPPGCADALGSVDPPPKNLSKPVDDCVADTCRDRQYFVGNIRREGPELPARGAMSSVSGVYNRRVPPSKPHLPS